MCNSLAELVDEHMKLNDADFIEWRLHSLSQGGQELCGKTLDAADVRPKGTGAKQNTQWG